MIIPLLFLLTLNGRAQAQDLESLWAEAAGRFDSLPVPAAAVPGPLLGRSLQAAVRQAAFDRARARWPDPLFFPPRPPAPFGDAGRPRHREGIWSRIFLMPGDRSFSHKLLAFQAFSATDISSSLVLFHYGGRELNPAWAPLQHRPVLYALSLEGATLATIQILKFVRKKKPRLGESGAVALTGLEAGLTVNNSILAAKQAGRAR